MVFDCCCTSALLFWRETVVAATLCMVLGVQAAAANAYTVSEVACADVACADAGPGVTFVLNSSQYD